MSVAIVDAAARAAALDPASSFIVQAPAGSGKTGLLIQRYLRLLAIVQRPEEILAITFTRKAAAEMRRRVLEALERAAAGAAPEEPNARLTWDLARAALERDREREWRLRENVARLRIQTIDSLCATLARQMPVVSRLGAPPKIVENAAEIYRDAAERTLACVEEGDDFAAHVARLLRHLDGDWAAARALLELMLARRDQWIRPIASFRADGHARSALEAGLRGERSRLLRRAQALMPVREAGELARLACYAAGHMVKSAPNAPIARLCGMEELPPADESGAGQWTALATFLLTGEAKFREKVDKNTGFPPGKGESDLFKKRMAQLLARLADVPGLCEALDALRRMPPAQFSDEQWDTLGAVVALLQRAPALLRVVFAERGEIDFPAIAEGALQALGDEEEPTDLLLALDARLAHLLVDEFQDTSLGQWELIARLTAGWSEGDGRTVFLVGDPMQSIYRFREADVALFLRARREGLPSVKLRDLRLATNFRSQRRLVDWLNKSFASILPRAEDAEAGAVPHARSEAHHPPVRGEAVRWHAFVGSDPDAARENEALRVVELVRGALREDAASTVAVLVRNRPHLDRIVPALKGAHIAFRAVDIEPLGGRQIIQDLLAIARALTHPADRVAWLSILRAPWCALTLADLHALTGGELANEGARLTVWELLNDADRMARLSSAGQGAAGRVRQILSRFVGERLRGPLRERVEHAWLALGGPACVERASDLEDAETFFDQLDRIEDAGDLEDPTVLEAHLADLYASPDMSADGRVQLMTIHKAKGLEFGTVIVPGLDRLPRPPDKPLFVWRARADGSLLMAPVRATGTKTEPAYDYLRELDKEAGEHEVERLFYVAATRAERRLHLLGFARVEAKGAQASVKPPSSRSLLGKAWSIARGEFEKALAPEPAAQAQLVWGVPPPSELRRLDARVLAIDVPEPPVVRIAPAREEMRLAFDWAGETARHVGTITHRWLQRIATEGLDAWDAERIAGLPGPTLRELARRGVPPQERAAAAESVARALSLAIADERGRWLLAAHPESYCEYRVRIAGPEGVRLLVMDRYFTDTRGERWIVDYKTSSHEGADVESFLDRERERYAEQLGRYASALGGTARTALYFPLLKGWREL